MPATTTVTHFTSSTSPILSDNCKLSALNYSQSTPKEHVQSIILTTTCWLAHILLFLSSAITLWMIINILLNFDHKTNNTDNILPLLILCADTKYFYSRTSHLLYIISKCRHDSSFKEMTRRGKTNTDPCSTLELPGKPYAPCQY